jgi:hypothetical protein
MELPPNTIALYETHSLDSVAHEHMMLMQKVVLDQVRRLGYRLCQMSPESSIKLLKISARRHASTTSVLGVHHLDHFRAKTQKQLGYH